jgi:glucokinase
MAENLGNNKYLVFDIGGTAVKYALFDDYRNTLLMDKLKTPSNYEDLIGFLKSSCINLGVKKVCIGVPGVVDYIAGVVIYAPNLKYLIGKNILLDLKVDADVMLENDANLAAIGEYNNLDEIDCKNFALITLGTGVGGGVILNSQLVKGRYSSFEIGHMVIEINGKKCGCGKRGCFEAYCSKSGIENIYKDLSSERVLSANEIFENNLKKDKIAEIAVNIYGNYLGVGLSNIANILNLDVIAIGGGLSELSDYFIKNTIKVFSKTIFPAYKNKTILTISKLKNFAALYGGYSLLRGSNEQI